MSHKSHTCSGCGLPRQRAIPPKRRTRRLVTKIHFTRDEARSVLRDEDSEKITRLMKLCQIGAQEVAGICAALPSRRARDIASVIAKRAEKKGTITKLFFESKDFDQVFTITIHGKDELVPISPKLESRFPHKPKP